MPRTRTIKIELLTGDPTGIRTIEFTNRKIKGIVIPRRLIHEAFQEDALTRYGVYFLLGTNLDSDESIIPENKVYIGQATQLKTRIKEHNDKKDFWSICICFTTGDNSFGSTDINYLENMLITRAWNVGRYGRGNKQKGNSENTISRGLKSDIEEYIEDLEILLGTLGFPILTPFTHINKDGQTVDYIGGEEEIYYLRRPLCEGRMIYTNEGFIVLKGSKGQSMKGSGIKNGIHNKREMLINDEVIELLEDGSIIFLKDHLFKTPSGAGMILSGSAINGWGEWKVASGKSLGENENHWQ